jgi:hypothetical protein
MHRPAERYTNSRNAIPESPLTPPPKGMAVMAAQLLAVEKDRFLAKLYLANSHRAF